MKNRILIQRLALACLATVFLRGDSCDSVIDDSGFDLWCGNELCAWDLDNGEIERVATWHQGDPGVSLTGVDTQISQLSDASSTDTTCIRFEVLANVEQSATMYLEMDFLDDGVVEFSDRIPASNWEPLVFLVTPPTWFENVRFILRKESAGGAVLAQIAVERSDACTGPALELLSRPLGAPCDESSECRVGECGPTAYSDTALIPPILCGADCQDYGECHSCIDDDDCVPGNACGIDWNGTLTTRECGAEARHSFGERCFQDSECETGVCNGSVCSECRDDAGCGGQNCTRRNEFEGATVDPAALEGLVWVPWQCAPQNRLRGPSEMCLDDDDCASDTCQGSALRVCILDGRLCSEEADCPLGALPDLDGFPDNGAPPNVACTLMGVADGICL